jgi:hydroxymethylpyrimidine pyrophosphatase-like HAD family hydrolase
VTAVDLVVTDLDGTLWSYDAVEQPHESTLAAWVELERRGVAVLVATGRRVTSTREPLARLGLAPSAVVLNGALALDLASDECFHRHHHTDDGAAAVLAAFRTHGFDPCVYVEHPTIEVYVSDAPSTSPEHLAALGDRAQLADLDEVVATMPVLSFGVFGHDAAALHRIAASIDDRAVAHVVADTWSDGHGITVAPVGLSKWSGVLAYCARGGIDPARVLAIGDETNDVELLTRAAIGLAMSDGHADARAAANRIVPPSGDGGWATILEYI